MITALAAILMAGCGPTRAGSGGPAPVDPLRLAQILPTPSGLTEDGVAREAPVTDVQEALAGRPDEGGVERLEVAGFQAGAIRRWRFRDTGRLTAVLSVWDERITATSVGSGSVGILADEDGARAWTPSEVPGSQGVQVGGDDPKAALAIGVGSNLIFLRAVGPVPERAIVRTMQLAVTSAEGGLRGTGEQE